MNLTDTQKVDLKKWAYEHAEDIARHNASGLLPKEQQKPMDYADIHAKATDIFAWITSD